MVAGRPATRNDVIKKPPVKRPAGRDGGGGGASGKREAKPRSRAGEGAKAAAGGGDSRARKRKAAGALVTWCCVEVYAVFMYTQKVHVQQVHSAEGGCTED